MPDQGQPLDCGAMDAELSLSGYREPLGLWMRRVPPPAARPELLAQRFEYTSRGDRVPGSLWLPRQRAECPLVLLQPGGAAAAEQATIAAACAGWVQAGVGVATIDLPLHGARSDHKLAARVEAALLAPEGDSARDLAFEFARQAVIDHERALDVLAGLDGIDTTRIAFVGFGRGALIGAAFCALDPRPRAAGLAFTGAGSAPTGLDPAEYVARIPPRRLLLVNAPHDPLVSKSAADRLHRAAGDAADVCWIEGADETRTAAALEAVWSFLGDALKEGTSSR
jgi:dienelactone hydrolase